MGEIVDFIKKIKSVHAFVFVMNELNPRFDESNQATFCQFYHEYGSEFLQKVNFIFTRAQRLNYGKK